MPQSLEERVAYLEGRMQDHAAIVIDLRSGLRELRGEMSRQFVDLREDMNKRFDDVDRRFADMHNAMDRRFTDVHTDMDRRFTVVHTDMDQRFVDMRSEIVRLDDKVDRHFTWLVGIQVGSLVALVGAIAGLYFQ
jgi:hypothetical protein